jgi:hypothetical protein
LPLLSPTSYHFSPHPTLLFALVKRNHAFISKKIVKSGQGEDANFAATGCGCC